MDDDQFNQLVNLMNNSLGVVKLISEKINVFQAQVQDDFAVVKARLRRIETTQLDLEDRVTKLERK
jgi:hypothetical protein